MAPVMRRIGARAGRQPVSIWQIAGIGLVFTLAACGGGTSAAPSWTFGPALAAASPTLISQATASSSSSNASSPNPAPATPSGSAPNDTPKPFSGRMTPQVLLVDGYVTMYMDLVNTGSEPLTFINTLYDIEPTRLYWPTVAFPWTSGGAAAVTRDGRFFPSPAIVQPGDRAVYVMGGVHANGTGLLAAPVANIKFCPTRGMDDIPSVPIEVHDVAWSTSDGLTTVRGTLVETRGSRRPDPPVVGVAFFDEAGAFVGAVVESRVGDRVLPGSRRSFTIEGRGVDASRIFRAEAYAYAS
jgi:hypothetical protein